MGAKTRYAAILMLIFLLSAMVGTVVVTFRPDLFPTQIATKEEMKERAATGSPTMFLSLVFNNLVISFVVITTSIARQKIIPSAIIAVNGFSIGGTIFKTVQIYGTEMLIPFLPHAVIELPAIILVATLSFVAIDEIKKVAPYISLVDYLTARLRIPREIINGYIFRPYFLYVVPMFVVAAAIEAYISSQLLMLLVSGLP